MRMRDSKIYQAVRPFTVQGEGRRAERSVYAVWVLASSLYHIFSKKAQGDVDRENH